MSYTNRLIPILAALALAVCGCRTADPLVSNSGTHFAEEALRPYLDSGALPGAISILYRDGAQEVACLGYADVAAKRPITLDDAYMQCSQTKGFCGVTVAKLVEEGRINLDDPVSKYLPEFEKLTVRTEAADGTYTVRPAKTVLTVRMCLNHTGGFDFELPNYEAMGGWSRRMPLRSVAAVAAGVPLLFDPGTRQKYSNVGIDIGAVVVETVTGMRWEDYLKANVLDPLGMTSTGFWPTEEQLAGKIEMYNCVSNAPAVWMLQNRSMQRPYGDDRVFASAGAGLWTTARDQYKFYKMLMNLGVGDNGARILKPETVKAILAVSTRPAGVRNIATGKVDDAYSLGLQAPRPEKDAEDAWFGHGGAWQTNCMVNWRRRELNLWVVQACGSWPGSWQKARHGAADRFFSAKIDSAGADAYTGRLK